MILVRPARAVVVARHLVAVLFALTAEGDRKGDVVELLDEPAAHEVHRAQCDRLTACIDEPVLEPLEL